ncbi:MAG: hypothetical protein R3E96_15490 [Planctomycetota bacterium]
MMVLPLLAALFLAPWASPESGDALWPVPKAEIRQRQAALLQNLWQGEIQPDWATCRDAAREWLAELPDQPLRWQLAADWAQACWTSVHDPEDARDRLLAALRRTATDLAFEPRQESPLPDGYPEPAPVGHLALHTYPADGLARTASSAGRDSTKAF